jgi:hypothetical protein
MTTTYYREGKPSPRACGTQHDRRTSKRAESFMGSERACRHPRDSAGLREDVEGEAVARMMDEVGALLVADRSRIAVRFRRRAVQTRCITGGDPARPSRQPDLAAAPGVTT